MNKRIREKVATRKAKNGAESAENEHVKPLAEAIQDARTSALNLGRAVVASVQGRAGEAFEQLKVKIVHTEEQAEHLIEKVPAVGPSAAKKLHDLTHSS